jgi:hypothetical protein
LLGISTSDVDYHLQVLDRDGYVHYEGNFDHGWAELLPSGQQRAREGFRMAHQHTQITVGAIIQNMSGGNVQAVGAASNTDISQVVNDPELLHQQLEELHDLLVDAVKSDLSARDLRSYMETFEALRTEMSSSVPRQSVLRPLLGKLAFLADVEGTIGLAVRVLPYVTALATLAAQRP